MGEPSLGQSCRFDMILCERSAEGFNPISKREFLDLPLSERNALIRGKKVKFFLGEVEVPLIEAVKSLAREVQAGTDGRRPGRERPNPP